jgi:energy-coupling factor transport system ATP-binding protein
MSYIEYKDVSYTYPGDFLAVDTININIEKGENIAIIGQNGAGKTTTVKMLNGLIKPSLGEVIVGGRNTKEYTTAQMSRNVGYVFQNPDDQIFHSTVLEEIEFGPKIMKVKSSKSKKDIDFALEITGMKRYRKMNPYNLSFSMRKFVTIAAIIAMDGDIMVFDEPTAGQDLIGLIRLKKILEKLQERGKTIITITHDMEFVVSNFKKVIVMANKKVIKEGYVQEIFQDLDIMKQAKLKQPVVFTLCNKLGIEENVVSDDDFVREYIKKIDK